MKKEYRLALCLLTIFIVFIFFGITARTELEKITAMHTLVEKHGSVALNFIESARTNIIEIDEMEERLSGAKTEKSISNGVSSIYDTYKNLSGEILLFRSYSRNEQKAESTERILYHLGGRQKFSEEIISLKLQPSVSSEDMAAVLKDGKKKSGQLLEAIDDTLKLEYNTVVENFQNAAGLFENLKFKLLSLFILLTVFSVISTYLIILNFSPAFKGAGAGPDIEKIKTRLIDLFDTQCSADTEKLLYIVSHGLGAHAARLFEKKAHAHSDECEYVKIGSYINPDNDSAQDIQSFDNFRFFLGNARIINEFVLYDLEAMIDKFYAGKEAVRAVRIDFIDYLKKYGIKTFLACPLAKRNGFKYVMSFYFKESAAHFTEKRIKKILELTASVSMLLENSDLINEMIKKNELLNSQNNELETFAHTVSHDLKTPLSGLMGFLKLSESELLKIDAGHKHENLWKYLGIEIQSAEKMNALINDILELSKAKNAALKLEKLDMKNLIDNNLKLHEDSIRQKNITVSVSGCIPEIEADLGSMSRLWSNLISNSVKYMDAGERREISITYKKSGDEHIFIFSDTGIGIARRYHPYIFTPFFRTREGPSAEGSGVGLSIVKKIIDRHMGSINFESAVGEGTTFYIRIPDNLGAISVKMYEALSRGQK